MRKEITWWTCRERAILIENTLNDLNRSINACLIDSRLIGVVKGAKEMALRKCESALRDLEWLKEKIKEYKRQCVELKGE